MNQNLILLPLLAQILLTALISFRLYHARTSEIKNKRIHPQKLTTATSLNQELNDSVKVSDNFSNQFEIPVVFYVLIIVLYITGMASTTYLILTSIFVALRYWHSYIHCSYNKVMHRFYVFITGTLLLWATWALFTIQFLSTKL